MHGQIWFGGRVWTFDYPGRALLVHTAASEQLFEPKHTVPLGFPADGTGRRLANFPSIDASVGDERQFTFLFDTGATVRLSEAAALRESGESRPANRATCFVVASIFDRWMAEHPTGRWLKTPMRTMTALLLWRCRR